MPKGGLELVNASSTTDMLLAAMFVAGRSCGPPDALSSSTLAAIQEKYVNSTCYYAGPILRTVTDNQTRVLPCYNVTFERDIVEVGFQHLLSMRALTCCAEALLCRVCQLQKKAGHLYLGFGGFASISVTPLEYVAPPTAKACTRRTQSITMAWEPPFSWESHCTLEKSNRKKEASLPGYSGLKLAGSSQGTRMDLDDRFPVG